MSKRSFTFFALIASLAGAYVLMGEDTKRTSQETAPSKQACDNNWRACRNAGDLMEHNKNAVTYRAICTAKAEEATEYGAPQWQRGWGISPFSGYYPEADIKDGKLTLVDDHALIPNRYGGKERGRIACFYDLEKDAVDRTFVIPLPSE